MKTAVKTLSIIIAAFLTVGFGPSSLRQGRKYLEKGEYVRALEKLTDALNEDPENPEIHRDLGIAYYKTGQYEQALGELSTAKEKLKKDGQTIFHLGLTYERLEQYDKAIAEYGNYTKLGRFNNIKREMQQRALWLIEQQTIRWAKERMAIEEQITSGDIPANTVAVAYFMPISVSEKLEPLHKGLTELLIVDLSMVKSLRVVERIKLKEIYDELGLGSMDVVDQTTAPRMGKLLGANFLVTGTFTGFGDDLWRIHPTLKAVHGESPTIESVEGKVSAFLQMEKELALEILDNLGVPVTQEERDSIQQNIPTESLEAFLAYCKGLDYTDKGMHEEAAKEFGNAVSIDPEFHQAKESLTETELLSQPLGEISKLESVWNSTLSAEKGKNILLNVTTLRIAQGKAKRVSGGELEFTGTEEVQVEVLIQW